MTQLPKINKMKFGIIDQTYMNTLASRSESFAEMLPSLREMVGAFKENSKTFLALITNNTNVLANYDTTIPIAWRYYWRRIDFTNLPSVLNPNGTDDDAMYTPDNYADYQNINTLDIQESLEIEDDESTLNQAYAYNLAELSNIATQPVVFGIDISSPSYPEDFRPQPVAVNSMVMVSVYKDVQGRLHYLFDRQGTHDGDCD